MSDLRRVRAVEDGEDEAEDALADAAAVVLVVFVFLRASAVDVEAACNRLARTGGSSTTSAYSCRNRCLRAMSSGAVVENCVKGEDCCAMDASMAAYLSTTAARSGEEAMKRAPPFSESL